MILDIPIHPVTEGNAVTLRCRKKNNPTSNIADFYKHGAHIGTGYKGDVIIPSVSKFDEGPYKCTISGAGESAESWLSVGVRHISFMQMIKFPASSEDHIKLT